MSKKKTESKDAAKVRAQIERQRARIEALVAKFVAEGPNDKRERWLGVALGAAYFEAWLLRCNDPDLVDRALELARACVGTPTETEGR